MRIASLPLITIVSITCLVDKGNAEPPKVDSTQKHKCSHVGSMPIRFSSAEKDDQLIVQIIGNNCEQPYLAVTISDSEGAVLYSHGFPALWASYDCGTVESCTRWVYDGAMVPAYSFSELSLPPLEQVLRDDYYFNVNEVAYAYAQSEDRPLLCFQTGKSIEDCIVFMDGRAVHSHSSGS